MRLLEVVEVMDDEAAAAEAAAAAWAAAAAAAIAALFCTALLRSGSRDKEVEDVPVGG